MSGANGERERPVEPGRHRGQGRQKRWRAPARSDQAPGEEAVQVNDTYAGGGPPPETEEGGLKDHQHPTGG